MATARKKKPDSNSNYAPPITSGTCNPPDRQPDPRHTDPVWLLGNALAFVSGDLRADALFRVGPDAIADDRWWLERRSRTPIRAARLKSLCNGLSNSLWGFVESPQILDVRVRTLADRLLDEWFGLQHPGPWDRGEAERLAELIEETLQCSRLLMNIGEVRAAAATMTGTTALPPAHPVDIPPHLQWLLRLPPELLPIVIHPFGDLNALLGSADEPHRTLHAFLNAAGCASRVLSIRRRDGDRSELDQEADRFAGQLDGVLREARDELLSVTPSHLLAVVENRASRLVDTAAGVMRVARDYPIDLLARNRRIVRGPMSSAVTDHYNSTMDMTSVLTGQLRIAATPTDPEDCLVIGGGVVRLGALCEPITDEQERILVALAEAKGRRVPSDHLKRFRDSAERPGDIIRRLPEWVRNRIDSRSGNGGGHRLIPPSRIVRA